MRKVTFTISISVFAILLALNVIALDPIQVTLQGPTDGSSTENFRTEFRYAFSRPPSDVQSCTLWIDSEAKATRQTLISLDNNKISHELTEGTYAWQITCNLTDGTVIESPQRTLTVESQVQNSEGYEIVYNNNGLRSYLVYASPGQSAVPLPGMKGGEDIRVRTAKSTYYVDLLKMGSSNGSYFTELRDRAGRQIHRLTVGQSLDLDFDEDKIIDARITLERTNRAVDAYFLVSPYPGSEIPVEEEIEEPSEPENIEEPETEGAETPVQNEPEEVEMPEEPAQQEELDMMPVVETSSNSEGKGLWIGLVLIIVAIIAVFFLLKKKSGKPGESQKSSKKSAPAVERSQSDDSFEVISSSSNKKK